MRIFQYLLCVCLAGLLTVASASDLVREQRMAEEIEEAILVGDPVWLEAGGTSFFAIHATSELELTKGGVVVVHGRGAHPDWPEVINPLRSELPNHGWETLSIQVPIAEANASGEVYESLIPEAAPRIAVAIDYLEKREVDYIVIAAHSLGARMVAHYLANEDISKVVKGFVAISMPLPAGERGEAAEGNLEKLKVGVLDVYGSRDIKPVTSTVRKRTAAVRKAEGVVFQSLEIEGANHFYVGLEETLIGRVAGWLNRGIKEEE